MAASESLPQSAPARDALFVRHRTLVLALVGLFVLVPFLGWRDLWYPDEPDIGQVAQAMYQSGDLVAPRRNGEIWVDYPPMVYWAGTLSSHLLGGMTAFSLRVTSALGAIAIVLLTALAASRFLGARAGLWSGFALLTFHHFVYEAESYRPDVLFTLYVAAGIYLYAHGCGERPRLWPRVGAFALFGLAILSKGPLGVLLPGLVLFLWHAGRREWKRLLSLAPLALVSLAVALPWFLACGKAMGGENMWHEFYEQNFGRFGSGSRGHEKPPLYYLRNLWIDFLPWSLLFPFAIAWFVRARRHREPLLQLALWWFGALFVFFSLAATKRQVYLLPAYPAAAILLGGYLAAFANERKEERPDPRPVRAVTAFFAGLFVLAGVSLLAGAAAYGFVLARLRLDEQTLDVARALRPSIAVLGVVVLALGAWIWGARRRRDDYGSLARLGVAQLPIFVVLGALALPALDPARTYVPAASWIRAELGDAPDFGIADPRAGRAKMGAFTFYSGILVRHLDTEADVARYLEENPRSLVLVSQREIEHVFQTPRSEWTWPVVRELQAAQIRYLVLRAPRGADGDPPR